MLSSAEPAALGAAPGALLCLFNTLVFEEFPLAGRWDFLSVALIPGSFCSSSEGRCLSFLLLAGGDSPLPVAPLCLLPPGTNRGRALRGCRVGPAVLAAQGSDLHPLPELYLPNYKLRAALRGSPRLYCLSRHIPTALLVLHRAFLQGTLQLL